MIKKIVSSLLLGGSIGSGPYLIATQLPAPTPVQEKNETIGFGETCLLSQETCDFMKVEKFTQDEEDNPEQQKIGNKYIQGGVLEKWNSSWEEFIKKKGNDYCGFGFFGYEEKTVEDVQTLSKEKLDVNNLENCYKHLVEALKKQQ